MSLLLLNLPQLGKIETHIAHFLQTAWGLASRSRRSGLDTCNGLLSERWMHPAKLGTLSLSHSQEETGKQMMDNDFAFIASVVFGDTRPSGLFTGVLLGAVQCFAKAASMTSHTFFPLHLTVLAVAGVH